MEDPAAAAPARWFHSLVLTVFAGKNYCGRNIIGCQRLMVSATLVCVDD